MLKRAIPLLAAAVCALPACVQTAGTVSPELATADPASIRIPGYFYGDRIGACDTSRQGLEMTLEDDFVEGKIAEVIGYDWDADHHKRSDSLTVRHEAISYPARYLFAATHTAVKTGDPDQIRKAVSLVVRIAQAETILDTMTVEEARRAGGRCYAGKGVTSAACHVHAPQFAADFGSSYLVSAIFLRPEMSESQRDTVNRYAQRLYRRYIQPWAAGARRNAYGFNQYANGGIGELAYAAWTGNKELAALTFNRMFQDIDNKFFADGYIDNNSFRGVRGFWYHTYGVNSALAVIGLAEAWHVRVPGKVRDKVVAATRAINVGVRDLKKFGSRSFSGYRGNASTDPKDARPHIHQAAIAIDAMARRYAHVTLERDATYLRKRETEGPSDFTVGFHPGCMVEQEAPRASRDRLASG